MFSSVDRNDKEVVVLEAATSVFLAHAFSAATTDMIQREAGVSKATMYACFPNKEAMFAAVIERQCATMTSRFQAIKTSPGKIAKTLTDVGLSYLEIVLSPSGLALFRVATAEASRFPDLSRRFYLADPRVVTSLVAARVDEAAQAGEIDVRAVGVETAAGLFVSMVRGEAQLESLTHPGSRPSSAQMDHRVQLAVTTFLDAFGAAAISSDRTEGAITSIDRH